MTYTQILSIVAGLALHFYLRHWIEEKIYNGKILDDKKN